MRFFFGILDNHPRFFEIPRDSFPSQSFETLEDSSLNFMNIMKLCFEDLPRFFLDIFEYDWKLILTLF